ncbi:hypothetical protein [Microseira wollei]|uniref:Uncharacterized protein n=1 Tax=Microseira wollei NIES-4236 TaxID=2530354 RepID=A0AAV3X2J7_9CYAN|nr:hypothetical protein [Microseira wollei]GET36168.1 hypothetical protein MiSe_09160 [Microseira wollei NIES-4236]
MKQILNQMTISQLTTVFFSSGLGFLIIAVLGKIKLGFAEINPGCFGRTLALILGMFCLIGAILLSGTFRVEIVNFVRSYLTKVMQEYIGFIRL